MSDEATLRAQVAELEERLEDARAVADATDSQVAEMREALEAFTKGYPDHEWRGLLHEQGCVGVRMLPNERSEDEKCKCDGDYLTGIVDAALSSDAGKALLERLKKLEAAVQHLSSGSHAFDPPHCPGCASAKEALR
jgi:hypothetical protein